MALNVTIWNEFRHEKSNETVKALYPDGIHSCLKGFIESDEIKVTLASLDDPDCGLPDEVLNNTDVLMWWGHMYHNNVPDDLVEKIRERVYAGMGFIPLHSAHHSKPFKRIIGATGNLTWGRNEKCIVWNLNPTHPIAEGVPAHFQLFEELYAEPFYVPKPDDLIFVSWFEDGNIFRGGMTYTRGLGKIFYFHPGHETCESFRDPIVQRIILNGIKWCAPVKKDDTLKGENIHQTAPVIE